MSRFLQRAPITKLLLDTLRALGRPVGDAEMPRGGAAGWIGQPNAEGTNFIAYSVLTPAAGGAGTGTLTEPGSDIPLGYVLTHFGVTRAQCEDQADLMRLGLASLTRVNVAQFPDTEHAYTRRVQVALVTSYGGIQRMGDTDPRVYGSTDQVSLLTTG